MPTVVFIFFAYVSTRPNSELQHLAPVRPDAIFLNLIIKKIKFSMKRNIWKKTFAAFGFVLTKDWSQKN